MTSEISIQEANYVDPRAGNDKFYRVFTLGSSWVTQYGRSGTMGVFTKIIDAGDTSAAKKAADAKFLSKIKKGYNPVRTGTITCGVKITEKNVSMLDALAQKLPLGATHTVVSAPVNAIDLNQQIRTDLTSDVRLALKDTVSRDTMDKDLNPPLPVRPMLASVQSEEIVTRAMNDSSWMAQYKYDGDRVVIEVTNGEIRVLNRQGLEKTKNVGVDHLLPFSALHAGRWVFDGEVVGRTLVLFDLITVSDGKQSWIDERIEFGRRYLVLKIIAKALGIPHAEKASPDEPVVIAPVAVSKNEKVLFLSNAISQQREGIILRHVCGPYESGRRSSTLIKHKLIKDADVIITDLHATKDSATLSVYGPDGQLVEVGAASTIGKGAVTIGDVWVVTFLYVTDPLYPRLFQPRLVKMRSDKMATECTLDQFADAGTNKIV